MLKVIAVLLWVSAGFGTLAAYNALDRMGDDPPFGAVMLGVVFWPAYIITDGLERMGAGRD